MGEDIMADTATLTITLDRDIANALARLAAACDISAETLAAEAVADLVALDSDESAMLLTDEDLASVAPSKAA
jgi:predicted transcriptional regulator